MKTQGSKKVAVVFSPEILHAEDASFDENVAVIDGTTNTVITTIAVGVLPWAFAWNYAQNRIYVANYHGSSVSVMRDAMTGIEEDNTFVRKHRVGATIFSGPSPLPEGKKMPSL